MRFVPDSACAVASEGSIVYGFHHSQDRLHLLIDDAHGRRCRFHPKLLAEYSAMRSDGFDSELGTEGTVGREDKSVHSQAPAVTQQLVPVLSERPVIVPVSQ